MEELSAPLVPADCDLRDFAFMPLDVKRLLTSETWVLGTGDERAAAISLWLESWHQVPAASLPDNDRMLAHLAQAKVWARVKAHALRGWVKCSDGRLYHAVVAEKVLEAWIEKLINSLSGSAGNAKRWGVEIDLDTISARVIEGADLLKAIAPQSKTLRKKQVVSIVAGSPPDQKTHRPPTGNSSPPESPPESPGDRNRQGQGQGQGQGFKNKARGAELPAWIPPEPWANFVEMRTKIRKPMTDAAQSLAIKTLERLVAQGNDAQSVLEQSVMNSWQGLFEIKRGNGQRQPFPTQQERMRQQSEANMREFLGTAVPPADPNVIDMEH